MGKQKKHGQIRNAEKRENKNKMDKLGWNMNNWEYSFEINYEWSWQIWMEVDKLGNYLPN